MDDSHLLAIERLVSFRMDRNIHAPTSNEIRLKRKFRKCKKYPHPHNNPHHLVLFHDLDLAILDLAEIFPRSEPASYKRLLFQVSALGHLINRTHWNGKIYLTSTGKHARMEQPAHRFLGVSRTKSSFFPYCKHRSLSAISIRGTELCCICHYCRHDSLPYEPMDDSSPKNTRRNQP